MSIFENAVLTAFNEVPAAPMETPPMENPLEAAPTGGDENVLNDLFGNTPDLNPDMEKLDAQSMAGLRKKAFDGMDEKAAMTWAGNLQELKKQCFADAKCGTCQTLATESMHMAYKYYQLWDETLNFNYKQLADNIGGAGAAPEADKASENMDLDAMLQQMDASGAEGAADDVGTDITTPDVDTAVPDADKVNLVEASMGMVGAAVLALQHLMGGNKKEAEKEFL